MARQWLNVLYVEGDGKYARFFSSTRSFRQRGCRRNFTNWPLSNFEQQALENMLPTLRADIELGRKIY